MCGCGDLRGASLAHTRIPTSSRALWLCMANPQARCGFTVHRAGWKWSMADQWLHGHMVAWSHVQMVTSTQPSYLGACFYIIYIMHARCAWIAEISMQLQELSQFMLANRKIHSVKYFISEYIRIVCFSIHFVLLGVLYSICRGGR
jgi:hypothetical protein